MRAKLNKKKSKLKKSLYFCQNLAIVRLKIMSKKEHWLILKGMSLSILLSFNNFVKLLLLSLVSLSESPKEQKYLKMEESLK